MAQDDGGAEAIERVVGRDTSLPSFLTGFTSRYYAYVFETWPVLPASSVDLEKPFYVDMLSPHLAPFVEVLVCLV